MCGGRSPGLLTWNISLGKAIPLGKILPVRGRWRSCSKALREIIVPFPQQGLYLSSFYPDVDPSALHENQNVAFKCCPNQNTAGNMKEGKAGQPCNPSQSPHAPKFCLCHKGRVNLRINESGTTVGGCLQPGGCSHFTTAFLFMTAFRLIFILQIIMAGCPAFNLGRVAFCISAGALNFVVSN